MTSRICLEFSKSVPPTPIKIISYTHPSKEPSQYFYSRPHTLLIRQQVIKQISKRPQYSNKKKFLVNLGINTAGSIITEAQAFFTVGFSWQDHCKKLRGSGFIK